MTTPAWPDLEALFHEALARHSEERAAFLAARCAGRPDLRAQLDAMLRAHEEATSATAVLTYGAPLMKGRASARTNPSPAWRRRHG